MVTASTVPDHIKPLALGGSDDDTNIRCLCKRCHDDVTAEQFGQQAGKAIGACGVDGMPTDPRHPWHAGHAPGGGSKLPADGAGHRMPHDFNR